MRQATLCHLVSHCAVEIGDTIPPPGFIAGRVESLDTACDEITIRYDNGLLRLCLNGAGLAWMDQAYVRARPPEPIDHRTYKIV